jgi:hypothetical protein
VVERSGAHEEQGKPVQATGGSQGIDESGWKQNEAQLAEGRSVVGKQYAGDSAACCGEKGRWRPL